MSIAIPLLNEVREGRAFDPLASDEVLAPRRSPNAKDPSNVAVRETRGGATRFSEARSRSGGHQLRPDDANENRPVGLLIFGRPHDRLKVFIDLIDDLEPSPDHGPPVQP
jgi:hypothetical protein